MTQDRATVTIGHQYDVIGSIPNGDIFNDF